jgi:hypothetical protein
MGSAITLTTIRLSRRQTRAALARIDGLQPCAPAALDYQDAVLIALRGRLKDRRREVPAAVWPDLERFLQEAPGLFLEVTPQRVIDGELATPLAWELLSWHVSAMLFDRADELAMDILAVEGLANALFCEPQIVVGEYFNRLLDAVLTGSELEGVPAPTP